MKRYLMTEYSHSNTPTGKKFEADTIEEIAGHFGILEESVQKFMSKNKKGQLTLCNYRCKDRNGEIEEAKAKLREEEIRQEAYDMARADLIKENKPKPARKTTKPIAE